MCDELASILDDLVTHFVKEQQSWRNTPECSQDFDNIAQWIEANGQYEDFKDKILNSIYDGINHKYTLAEKQSYPSPNIGVITTNAGNNIRRRLRHPL